MIDKNDLQFITERYGTPILSISAPIVEGRINPHVSRFYYGKSDNQVHLRDIYYSMPVYYATWGGEWRPISEVMSRPTKRGIALKPDWMEKMDIGYFRWLQRKLELMGKELTIDYGEFAYGIQPRHIEFNLTLTVYPNPHPESTSVDGWVAEQTDAVWATIRAAAGDDHQDATGGQALMVRLERVGTNWSEISRSIFLYDTSPLTASANISETIMSLKGTTTQSANDLGGTWTYNVYTSNPASNTDLVNGDYATLGDVAQCDTAVSFASFASGNYSDFTMNSTGLGNVSKTGISKFGFRNANYDGDNVEGPGSGTNNATYVSGYFAAADTSNDPKMVVTYTLPASAGGGSNFLLVGVG